MKKTFLMLSVAAFLLCSGCASILSKNHYPVSINSSPAGATVTIVDRKGHEVYKNVTPAIVMLKAGAGFFSKASYFATIEMEGYQTRTVPIDFMLDGMYFGNILFGGLIGILIVDPATGAMWKLKTEFLDVTLKDKVVAANGTEKSDPALFIYQMDEIPDTWKDNLIPVQE